MLSVTSTLLVLAATSDAAGLASRTTGRNPSLTKLAKSTRPAKISPRSVSRNSEETSQSPPAAQPKLSVADVGGTAPMGKFFDPLGFAKNGDAELKRYRESEITHGRVAMLGALGFLAQEYNEQSPLFNGLVKGPAISHFDQINTVAPGFWALIIIEAARAELARARKGWQDPATGKMFALKDDYTPGDLGWDPLGVKPQNEASLITMKNKELNNGRLAMIALAGFMAQELVTGKPVFPLK
uniref:Uncharacterized protein n=1 Tax=Lotharella globosa TaxID=91324 RepID=A0A6U2Y0N1_9EUKA|mmetsp:Transcript_15117/g.29714  ORF Transcript_15117/g.29714 Transcript_15117/m.29714 type:complete len:241 (+) Transcript_15117:33-755(+)